MSIKPWLIAISVLATCQAVAATASADVKQAVLACKQQSDNFARLHCYDQIAAQLSAQPITEVTQPLATANLTQASIQPTAQMVEDDFGRTKTRPSADLENIRSRVKTLTKSKLDKFVLTLENGQEWRQTDNYTINIKVGDTVVIEKAALGSFLLNVEGANRKIRVKRVE